AEYNEAHFEKEQTVPFGETTLVIRDDVTKTGSLTIAQPITGLYAAVQYGRFSNMQQDLSFETLRQAKRDIAFQAAEAFLNAYQAQEQEEISGASLNAAKRQYEDAQAIQRVGRLSQGDVLKFQLALSQAETRAAQARTTKQVAFAMLRQLIQAKDEDELLLEKNLPKLEEETVDIQKGIEQALAHRPEAKRAELATELADYNKDLAYAQFIPSVNLFKKWDRNFGEVAGLGAEKETSYYGISLQWDIWSNGSSVFAVREAIANKTKAEATRNSAKDGVKLDVIQAWQNFQAAKQTLKFAQTGVAQAEEAYRIDQTRFKNGQISATDLIFSESAMTTAQGGRVSAETQYLLWHFRLQRSMGKDIPQAQTAS
ncbi:MAG: TolC family protein, partial [Pseudobdellovibrionaceae bacterium]|nr:TolC family protein [Pseudobdellovibrionaceae bacterium]